MDTITDERQQGWFWDVNDIFESGLSVHAIAVRVFLARSADKNGRSFPSFKTIAEKCSISRRKAIEAVQELIDKGWLDKIPRSKEGKSGDPHSASNLYILKDAKRGAQGALVHDMHQGGARHAPGVVHDMHPKDYPHIKDYPVKDNNARSLPKADEGRVKNPAPGRHEYSGDFESFWSVYPRKREKQKAYRAWQARTRAGVVADELIEAAKAYARECEIEGRPERFIKYGSTFLGPDGTYKDYLDGTAAKERASINPPRRPQRKESAVDRALREAGVL